MHVRHINTLEQLMTLGGLVSAVSLVFRRLVRSMPISSLCYGGPSVVLVDEAEVNDDASSRLLGEFASVGAFASLGLDEVRLNLLSASNLSLSAASSVEP